MVFVVLSYSWTSNTVDQKKVALQVWLRLSVCYGAQVSTVRADWLG